MIDSSKQTVYEGIKQSHKVTINYVTLNRSCSVVNAWWTINKLDKLLNQNQGPSNNYMKHLEAMKRKDEIDRFKKTLIAKAQAENEEVDVAFMR